MLLGQELKFKNKLCNLKLGTFFSALEGMMPGIGLEGHSLDIISKGCIGI